MWIEDFRRRFGLDRFELAEIAGVSEALIYILENQRKAITHPLLANRIAEACGATAAQRDSIVAEKHRGTWTPPARPKPRPKPKRPEVPKVKLQKPQEEARQDYMRGAAKAVVAIAPDGEVLQRYESLSEAIDATGVCGASISRRCMRMIQQEFAATGFTFRYADEWDGMNGWQRRADLSKRRYNTKN